MSLHETPTRWRGVTRNVLLLGLVSFFTDVSSEMIVPLLPAFLVTIGVSQPTIFLGWIEGIADSTVGLLKLVSGWWSDKVRARKPLVLAGYSISSLMRPAIALATAGVDKSA